MGQLCCALKVPLQQSSSQAKTRHGKASPKGVFVQAGWKYQGINPFSAPGETVGRPRRRTCFVLNVVALQDHLAPALLSPLTCLTVGMVNLEATFRMLDPQEPPRSMVGLGELSGAHCPPVFLGAGW